MNLREEIKKELGLLSEQAPLVGTWATLATCQSQGSWGNTCWGVNNLQVGDVVDIGNHGSNPVQDHWFVTSVGGPCPSNYGANGWIQSGISLSSVPSTGCPSACPNEIWSNYNGITDPSLYTNPWWNSVTANGGPNLPQGDVITGCPPITPPTTGCDPSAWSNYTNWSTNWVNLGPFNSSNPNQPCNFICNKIQDFNNNLVGAGPIQTNQLNCKLDVAQQQEQIHNCNC
mgnify:CR=1 FL=1